MFSLDPHFLGADQLTPFLAQVVFFMCGIVLMLVDSFRGFADRKTWRVDLQGRREKRYKPSLRRQIESALYWVGILVCWSVCFPEWWLRASCAVLAVAAVVILPYRFNLRAEDPPPHDSESVLQLSKPQAATVKGKD